MGTEHNRRKERPSRKRDRWRGREAHHPHSSRGLAGGAREVMALASQLFLFFSFLFLRSSSYTTSRGGRHRSMYSIGLATSFLMCRH